MRIVTPVGLTLQQFHGDLLKLQPELVILNCHGSKDGCLLFEDGRGVADFIPGDRLFPLSQPQPQVLFLAACHSENVLKRAREAADSQSGAIVFTLGETTIEVAACVAFQTTFYPALLGGETAGAAFDAARRQVANDPSVGDLIFAGSATPPSEKFQINPNGRGVRLPAFSSTKLEAVQEPQSPSATRHAGAIRRASDRFLGRRREMAKVLDDLLPMRAGIREGSGGGERRLVTLTKEGGIGKTALVLAVADWIFERDYFPGGIFELSCENIPGCSELQSQLLSLFGVPLESQRGNLLQLLALTLKVIPDGQPILLLMDNLDDLCGLHARPEVRGAIGEVFETLLTVKPELRILATSRWPLGLGNHELELEVPPLDVAEARDVFLSHLESPPHRLEVLQSWKQEGSTIRQLIELSGRQPQSLKLLAHQMKRKGMTLDKLRDEAQEDLLKVLAEPMSSDDETDRQKRVRASYELSYRHLSQEAQLAFARLSFLPGGVLCGEPIEKRMRWNDLLGPNWRDLMERELDYFALVHFEPGDIGSDSGTFQMLNPMIEFARKKYEAAPDKDWESKWVEFWRHRIETWDSTSAKNELTTAGGNSGTGYSRLPLRLRPQVTRKPPDGPTSISVKSG